MLTAAHPRAWTGAATAAATHTCPAPLPAETAPMILAAVDAGAESGTTDVTCEFRDSRS